MYSPKGLELMTDLRETLSSSCWTPTAGTGQPETHVLHSGIHTPAWGSHTSGTKQVPGDCLQMPWEGEVWGPHEG